MFRAQSRHKRIVEGSERRPVPTELFFLNAQNRSTVMAKKCGLADIEARPKAK